MVEDEIRRLVEEEEERRYKCLAIDVERMTPFFDSCTMSAYIAYAQDFIEDFLSQLEKSLRENHASEGDKNETRSD